MPGYRNVDPSAALGGIMSSANSEFISGDDPAEKAEVKPGSKTGSIANRNFDVVIVGAGPAGLACARVLQDSSLSVLILEKNEQIGPKTCAGGIVETVELLDLPETKARSFNAVTVFIREKQYEFNTHLSLKVVDRGVLGHHQAGLLKDAGNITILAGTAVRKIDSHRVATTAGEFSFRYLVGADGSTSKVRRHLKVDSRYMAGIYYDIDNLREHMIFRLDGRAFKTGYIWEFPHRQFTNIGFYYNPIHFKAKEAVRILRRYMFEKGYPMNSQTFRSFPINHWYRGSQFGENIFLAGDAAGLASKLTGEGIAYAMVSGREIARRIMDPQYEMRNLKKVVAYKKKQDNLANFLEKIPFGLNTVLALHITALKARFLRWPN